MMTMVISGSDGVTFPDSTNQFSGGAFSFKNRLINGGMVIDQRNAGAAVTTSGAFSADRWAQGFVGAGALSLQQVTDAPTGFVNSIKSTVTTADGSLAASDNYQAMYQTIEGNNIADLAWGTASAKTITVSFWAKASVTGTYCFNIRNNGAARSYVSTFAIASANTWEYKTITVDGDTSGTWLTTNGVGAIVMFGSVQGSDKQVPSLDTWTAGNYMAHSSQTNWIGTLNATLQITGVQLEVGSVATPFERRPFGAELVLCQRYACSSFPLGTAWGQNAGTAGAFSYIVLVGGTSAGFGISMPFPVTMRANPTLTYYNPSAANDKWRNTIANADSASGAGVNIRAWGTQITNYQVAGDVASQTCQVHWSVTAEL
jgi:hypothetical protein